ncbi:MAG: hypothetical protein Q9167_002413 [Letrouitia subvulpina]
MPSSRPGIIALSEIPTVSDLYKDGSLEAPKHLIPPKSPSSALNSKVCLIRTSITSLAVTSIVNAANNSLLGGAGVDGAIHSAAGPSLLRECRLLGGCETGAAKITLAYDLPSQHIIHTVGPVYSREKRKRDGLQTELLASCYQKSLQLAAEHGGSVAFSCLSTGVYGYPSGEAAEVATREVRRFLEGQDGPKLEKVVFCCFERKDEVAYQKLLPYVFPPADGSDSESDEKAAAKPLTEYQRPKQEAPVEGLDNDDWETVENPNERVESQSTSVSEEGEKIERHVPIRTKRVAANLSDLRGPESEIPTKNQLLRDCSSKPKKSLSVTFANPTRSTESRLSNTTAEPASVTNIKQASSSSSSPPKRRRVKFSRPITRVPFRPSASSFAVGSTLRCPSQPRDTRILPNLPKPKRVRAQAPISRYSPYFNPAFHTVSSTELLDEHEKEAEKRLHELQSELGDPAEKNWEVERILRVGEFTAETCRLNDVPGKNRSLEEAMEGLLVHWGFTPKGKEAEGEEQEIG